MGKAASDFRFWPRSRRGAVRNPADL